MDMSLSLPYIIFGAERVKEAPGVALYSLGDMVWVRIGTYPYWPAMVSRVPYLPVKI